MKFKRLKDLKPYLKGFNNLKITRDKCSSFKTIVIEALNKDMEYRMFATVKKEEFDFFNIQILKRDEYVELYKVRIDDNFFNDKKREEIEYKVRELIKFIDLKDLYE